MRDVSSIRDSELAGGVIRALSRDGRLNVADVIQVFVENGVVQLTGTVDSAEQKQVARRLAAAVPGVREVRDALVVTMRPGTDDSELQARAQEAIARDTSLDLKDVGVEVEDGVARLVGQVPDAAAEQQAEAAVGDTKGVESVVSDLFVGEARRDEVIEIVDDATLRGRVAQALSESGIVVFDDQTAVSYGIVHLRGRVLSRRDAEQAERLALAVDGVQSVRNELVAEMERPSRSADEELAASVMHALGRDPVANATYVKAIAFDGDVYLHGHVDSIAQQNAAAEATRRVQGVKRVFNNVVVSDRTAASSDDKGTESRRRVRKH